MLPVHLPAPETKRRFKIKTMAAEVKENDRSMGNIMGISWEYHGNIMGISWESIEHYMGSKTMVIGP